MQGYYGYLQVDFCILLAFWIVWQVLVGLIFWLFKSICNLSLNSPSFTYCPPVFILLKAFYVSPYMTWNNGDSEHPCLGPDSYWLVFKCHLIKYDSSFGAEINIFYVKEVCIYSWLIDWLIIIVKNSYWILPNTYLLSMRWLHDFTLELY